MQRLEVWECDGAVGGSGWQGQAVGTPLGVRVGNASSSQAALAVKTVLRNRSRDFRNAAHSVESWPSPDKAALHETVMVLACKPSTQEAGAGGSEA